MEKPNIVLRVLSWIWGAVDAARKIMHLLFLILVLPVLLLLLFEAMSPAPVTFPASTALVVQPVGFLVEQYEGSPFDRAKQRFNDNAVPQAVVQDIVDVLEHAGDDDRIEAVHFELSGLAGGGLSKLQRIADAMAAFQASGKPIIASGDFFSQAGYYLAAQADELYLHPEGILYLPGYGIFKTYYKNAIDLLRIDWNIFRVGTHKSFVEPYVRMDMSDEDKEAITSLTEQLWSMYRQDVVAARGLDDGVIQDFAGRFLQHIEASGGDLAAAAHEQGLVDDLLTHKQLRDRLIEITGADPEYPDEPNLADMGDYLAQVRLLGGARVRDENVAVIIASGHITFGAQPPGKIGSDSTSWLLRRALHDDSVKAVVLRVDSPGGSAFASDVIANEIEALRAAGKPVVASMSSVAASGGYWISAGADKIFASPSTITGSIGIFGMLPTYQRTLDAVGIGVDGVGTTIWSGELRPDREMSEHAKQLFQTVIEDGYRDFITRVSVHRGMEPEAVDAIAQGRVWTGADALDNGLIDEFGDLDDAVAAAAELADLAEGSYGVRHIDIELSPTEQLIVDLLGSIRSVGIDPSAFAPAPTRLEHLAGRFESILEPMLRFNDPKGVYSHCFCEFR